MTSVANGAFDKRDNVVIFDTTMRDGEQSPGASMSHDEKLELAKILEEMGVEIVQIAGASAGSIVGSHLAAGWSVDQMRRLAIEANFAAFKDLSLRGFLFEGGLYAGDSFERWMHTGLKGARFKDLPRDLFVTAVDLFGRRPFFFSRQATPDFPVSKAVRCSMAIPWVWRPLRWEHKLLVDGQLMPWIPSGIEIMQGSESGPPLRTVMLRLISEPRGNLPAKRHLWPWDFAKILLETMLSALENQRVSGSLWENTILINVGMWLERFVIITISLHRDFLPSSWTGYSPTYVEIGTYIGSFGLFFTCFLLFCRVLPLIAISEVKGVLSYARSDKNKESRHGH